MNKFMRAIDSVTPIKKGRMRANSKPWFDLEINSKILNRNKLYSRCKQSCLETDKDKFKTSNIFLQKMLHRKKSSCFEES